MLKPSLLRFLVRLQRHYQLTGPLLTLGVQDILCRYEYAQEMLQAEGVAPVEVPPQERQLTTSLFVRQHQGDSSNMHAATFFRMLGIEEYADLDASDSEGPQLIHDLNEPVPNAWHERYNWVLDSGTTEHIFDIRAALGNIARLTRVGGHVMHVGPMNGWANHGFYQFSPCLYYDFYSANGFAPVVSFVATAIPQGGLEFARYNYDPRVRASTPGDRTALFLFLARKNATVARIANPIQAKYTDRLGPLEQRWAG